jgi:hypothetical protein
LKMSLNISKILFELLLKFDENKKI